MRRNKGAHRAESNPARAQAAHERRRSNAAGTHGDRRLKRLRSRSAARSAALREW